MFRLVFFAILTALLVGPEPAMAQPRRAPSGDVQPLDRFLPQIRSRYPGTFYDADGPFMDDTGNPHYRLKWMTPEGRVIWLDTDARTGRVLGVEHGAARGRRYTAPPPEMGPPPGAYANPRRNFNEPPPGYRSQGGYGSAPLWNDRGAYGRNNGYGHGYWGGHGNNWGGHSGHPHHGG